MIKLPFFFYMRSFIYWKINDDNEKSSNLKENGLKPVSRPHPEFFRWGPVMPDTKDRDY